MGWFGKVMNWMGMDSDEEAREELISIPPGQADDTSRKINNNVVSLQHSSKSVKVVVCEPTSFEEAQALADHLKARKQVIINFENTEPEVVRRIIDFISGTTYALEGSYHQLGKSICVFAPSNVEVARDHRSLMRRSQYGHQGGE